MIPICVEYGPATCLAWNKIKVHFLNTLSCIAIFHICYIIRWGAEENDTATPTGTATPATGAWHVTSELRTYSNTNTNLFRYVHSTRLGTCVGFGPTQLPVN